MSIKADRLQWPFFDEPHRQLAAQASEWAAVQLGSSEHPT